MSILSMQYPFIPNTALSRQPARMALFTSGTGSLVINLRVGTKIPNTD